MTQSPPADNVPADASEIVHHSDRSWGLIVVSISEPLYLSLPFGKLKRGAGHLRGQAALSY